MISDSRLGGTVMSKGAAGTPVSTGTSTVGRVSQ